MARDSPFQTRLDPVRTGVTVLVTVVLFKCVFSCPCVSAEETALHCWLYLLLPVSVMVLVLSLVDSRLLRLWQCSACGWRVRAEGDGYPPRQCGEGAGYCCSVTGSYVVRVLCASALWLVVALMDGDWYVCIRTVTVTGTGQDQLACKDLPSPEEAEVLRRYSSESRVVPCFVLSGFSGIGPLRPYTGYAVHDPLVIIPTENRGPIIVFIIITILVFVIIALLIILGLSLLLVVHTCIMSCRKPYYKSLFEAYVEQETTAMLEEKLHEQAVERAKLLSESVLHGVNSRHENCGLEDGYIGYQSLAETEENMWRKMSHPAFHLLGVVPCFVLSGFFGIVPLRPYTGYAVHDPLVIIPTENRGPIIVFIIITILVFVVIY